MGRNKAYAAVLEAAGIALIGALLFMLLHVPLPWILGPVASVTAWRLTTKRPLAWPYGFRQTALVLLGYVLGASFTRDTALQIIQQLPFMLISTVLTVLLSLLFGILIARRLGMDIASGIFGSVPGGLSQMLVLSEETERVDATMVAFMQTIRVLAVIFFVPFLAVHGLGKQLATGEMAVPVSVAEWTPGSWQQYALYTAVALAGAWGGQRIGLPASALTGPLLSMAAVAMAIGGEAPHLPPALVLLSQFAIGIYIGLHMEPHMLKNIKVLGFYTVLGSIFLVLFSLMIAFMLTQWTSMSLTTAFLSTAPGGIAEMGVTASMVHADLSMVSGYQLFRVFFIMFVLLPLLQWWIRRNMRVQNENEENLSV